MKRFFLVLFLAFPLEGSPLKPEAGQWDLGASNLSGFVTPASLVDVRENTTTGTPLHLRDLGVATVQVPTLDVSYWITALNGLSASIRYFDARGNAALGEPSTLNGAILAPGISNSTNPHWVSASLFYERRLVPSKSGLDLRLGIGAEYTSLDFRINGGQAPVIPSSPGSETKEDFYRQELPLPTLRFETLYAVSPHWTLDNLIQGNWINHWNSQRQEGGTVYLSQSGFEAHLRARYVNRERLGNFEPEVGLFYFYYRQVEESNEDGNRFTASFYGPEAGLRWSSR